MKGTKESLVSRVVKAAINSVNDTPVIQKEIVHTSKLKNIEVFTKSANVEIIIHEEPCIDVVLETYEDGPKLTIHDRKETLEIRAEVETQVKLLLFKSLPSCRLLVKVPSDIANNWLVQTSSGKAVVGNILTDTASFSASSGKVIVSDIKANSLELNASSGRIRANNIKVDHLNFSVSSGTAELDSIYGNVIGSANSGSITMRNTNSHQIQVKASSGNISLEDIQAKELLAKANSGGIKFNRITVGEAEAIVSSGNIKVFELIGNLKSQTNSGNIRVDLASDSALDLRAGSGNIIVEADVENLNASFNLKTNSGSINTDVPLEAINKSDRKVTGINGEGTNPVKLETRSGDIKIRKK